MPTGTTSYRSGSSAAITLPAETQEMACSALRPPNTTATRSLPAFPLIAATLVEPVRAIPPTDRRCDSLVACRTGGARPPALLPAGSAWPAPPSTSTPRAARWSACSSCSPRSRARRVTALWLFFVALFIDGTDGMLARRFRVKETIPWFDGALLDNIVDYLTYVFAPVVLLWTTDSLPDGAARLGGRRAAAAGVELPVLPGRREDRDDHFFLGFPSYWNVVAFYAIVLDVAPTAVAIALVVFAVLVFVPIRYLYPSRMTTAAAD